MRCQRAVGSAARLDIEHVGVFLIDGVEIHAENAARSLQVSHHYVIMPILGMHVVVVFAVVQGVPKTDLLPRILKIFVEEIDNSAVERHF